MVYKIKITPLKAEDDTVWAKEHTDLLSHLCPLKQVVIVLFIEAYQRTFNLWYNQNKTYKIITLVVVVYFP